MIEPDNRTELIIEFKDWLISNRFYLQSKLRKYNAIRYYIVTMSIGCGVFVVNSAFDNPGNVYWSIPVTLIFILLTIFSYRISEHLSGLKHLKKLPIYKSEIRSHWIQYLPQITGYSHSLLSDSYVVKAIKHSKRKRMYIPVFFNAMICIADAVKDEKTAPEVI